jgi:hypothetical protein
LKYLTRALLAGSFCRHFILSSASRISLATQILIRPVEAFRVLFSVPFSCQPILPHQFLLHCIIYQLNGVVVCVCVCVRHTLLRFWPFPVARLSGLSASRSMFSLAFNLRPSLLIDTANFKRPLNPLSEPHLSSDPLFVCGHDDDVFFSLVCV